MGDVDDFQPSLFGLNGMNGMVGRGEVGEVDRSVEEDAQMERNLKWDREEEEGEEEDEEEGDAKEEEGEGEEEEEEEEEMEDVEEGSVEERVWGNREEGYEEGWERFAKETNGIMHAAHMGLDRGPELHRLDSPPNLHTSPTKDFVLRHEGVNEGEKGGEPPATSLTPDMRSR